MIKLNKTKIISIALIVISIICVTNPVMATINPEDYNPGQVTIGGTFIQRAGVILGGIKYIGIALAVLGLVIIGLKYLFSSVEGKAEYKKTMVPYLIGCFMLVGVSLIIQVIETIAKE